MAKGSRDALRLATESANRRRRAKQTDEGRRRFRSDDLQPSSGAEEIAEERLLAKPELTVTDCKLAAGLLDQQRRVPDGAVHNVLGAQGQGAGGSASTRSTFLMVFSPNRELIASTHGDHNIYISRVQTGECVQVLRGHPRTPWCVAFHPSKEGVLASGCLGGHVRVWDLAGNGSEVWKTDGVVASLAFHPTDTLLAVAAFDELLFWDWRRPEPFAKVKTRHEEKVRFVKFDQLGHTLITGIANLSQYQQAGLPQASAAANIGPPRYNASAGPRPHYEGRRYTLAHRLARYEQLIRSYGNTSGPSAEDDVTTPSRESHAPDTPTGGSRTATAASTTSTSTPSVSVQNSASQTLSDLAQAATNQLMAESGQQRTSAAHLLSSANSSRESSMERDDPLLSDHPYGLPSRMISFNDIRPLRQRGSTRHEAWEPASNNSGWVPSWRTSARRPWSESMGNTDPPWHRRYPSTINADHSYYRTPPEAHSGFRHSPESEFVEVNAAGNAGRLEDGYYLNPDRTPSDLDLRRARVARLRSQRERRLRELLDRRQTLVSQIEHLRSARELLFPAELNMPGSSGSLDSVVAASNLLDDRPSRQLGVPATTQSPLYIDEWAVNRRLSQSLEQRQQHPYETAGAATRLGGRSLLRRTSTTEINPAILNSADVERATETVVVPPRPTAAQRTLPPLPAPQPATDSSEIPQLTGDTVLRVRVDGDLEGERTVVVAPTASEETTQETSSQTTSTNQTETATSQNAAVVLLNRHIEHMQSICRDSLNDLAVARQRRQVVRLQNIRR